MLRLWRFIAIVMLGMSNTRLKDFYDLWVLATDFSFDGTVLGAALTATFVRVASPLANRRKSLLPRTVADVVALTPLFAADAQKQQAWNAQRMFNGSSDRRLPQILASSRDYQSAVSEQLAEQVVDALWELLRGFQIADGAANGRLLGNVTSAPFDSAQGQPLSDHEDWNQHLYGGLITTLMRLVFMLYAEDEGIMPNDPVYQQYYSVSGLYEQLRSDNSSYPDTMDDRYGAWVGLLSLFRLIYEGGGATPDYLPAQMWQSAELALAGVRLRGDVSLA
jgi:hypothetical protein